MTWAYTDCILTSSFNTLTVKDMISLSALEPNQKGLVHLYTGNGKGKTTAAVGLAVRALGSGMRVLFCQFLKGRDTGELAPLEQLGASVLRAKSGCKFLSQMNKQERAALACGHCDCLQAAAAQIYDGAFDLLVLDEVVDAVNAGLVDENALLTLLRERPGYVEVVLTGRNPSPALCEAADYHTDFVCRRHPYEKGIAARRGIEF